ncbi:MAG: hypothetical protein J0M24_27490 [Verrucomicrobia bacterium]|nr:hypothetical protein [Verrucomicrobiota bacterium]
MNKWAGRWLVGLGALALISVGAKAAEELLADFEGPDFGSWTTTGTAFGNGPASGTLPEQAPVGGFRGNGLANSFHGGDRAVGTLTSPLFPLKYRYLNFLVGGGETVGKTCVNVLVDGAVVRSATGRDEEFLTTATFDLGEFVGRNIQIQIVDAEPGGWGHVSADHFVVSDQAAMPPYVQNPEPVLDYTQPLRPQFHVTPKSGQLHNAQGLRAADGAVRFFLQNPRMGASDPGAWRLLVSSNWVEWKELTNGVVAPGERRTGWVLGEATPPPSPEGRNHVVALTRPVGVGGTDSASAFSASSSGDGGLTWSFDPEPRASLLLPRETVSLRSFWFEPTREWRLPLVKIAPTSDGELPVPAIAWWTSPDSKTWKGPGLASDDRLTSPSVFELPLPGTESATRWVLWLPGGNYWLGRFEGLQFQPDAAGRRADWGTASVTPLVEGQAKGRRTRFLGELEDTAVGQHPWRRWMGFPQELSLERLGQEFHLARWPVPEIRHLFASVLREDFPRPLAVGEYPLKAAAKDLLDLEVEFIPGTASEVVLSLRGQRLVWSASTGDLEVLNRRIPSRPQPAALGRVSDFAPPWGPDFRPWEGSVRWRILLDRMSLEVFTGGGLAAATFGIQPDSEATPQLEVKGGAVSRMRMTFRELRSSWPN